MAYYSSAAKAWQVAAGEYRVSIGSNERALAVSASFSGR
jgi:hypothetical protein